MKTIADLKGAEFLRACNRIRHTVADLLTKSDVLKISKEQPVFTGKETAEERQKILTASGKDKLDRIFDLLLDKYADETNAVLVQMCIIEPGEDPTGFDLAIAGFEIITSPKMIDFFTRLMKSVQSLGVD